MGAQGVVLAALGAHAKPGSGLEGAAYLLLLHAVAVLAGGVLIERGPLWRPALVAATGGWATGAVLFSGTIAMQAFTGHRPFPLAAPTGGTILIAAWLALCVAALIGGRQE
ncbi:MAG: DUF423 domain-containing protein [Hyphomicrobiaceae bacterium]|nr:MAG: DUF423 domain-containing protein [Hyphomicrobiaceae bacterium]